MAASRPALLVGLVTALAGCGGSAANGGNSSSSDTVGSTADAGSTGTSSDTGALGPFEVVAVTPLRDSLTAQTLPEITVDFTAPADLGTIEGHALYVFGRWTGVIDGEATLEDDGHRLRFTPSTELSVGEMVTVALADSVASVEGDPLPAGYAWSFWTAAGPGSLDLVETAVIEVREPNEGGIQTYGAYAGDLDHDGFHDFTVPNESAHDVRVFLNDGVGNYGEFTTIPIADGSAPSTNEGADFDRDGHIDFAIGNIGAGTVIVFRGDGAGTFVDAQTFDVGAGTRGLCVLDLDSDANPDIITASRVSDDVAVLFSDGLGGFSDPVVADTTLLGETSCAVGDANGDGLQDVFVGAFASRQIAVLLSDGDGGLDVASSTNAGGVAWMLAAGDLDGDGNVDVVSANGEDFNMALLRGDGAGGLSEAETYPTGQFPLAIDVGDLDGDGDLDVVTSNFFGGDFTLFENDGAGGLSAHSTLPSRSAGSCAVLHDRDRDGDLDMTGIDEEDDLLLLFDNPGV